MRTGRLLFTLAALATAGCGWNAPPHDAGQEAWVSAAVQAVLGRRPLGTAEVRALAQLADDRGREAVVDVLFTQPEYVVYWSNVLADDLQVQRAGPQQVAPDCTAPALLEPDESDALAHHLATGDPSVPFCKEVKVTFKPKMTAEHVYDAIDAAAAGYKHTLIDDLPYAKELSKPVAYEVTKDPQVSPGKTHEVDIEAQGGTASNIDYTDGAASKLGLDFDPKRWAENHYLVYKEECPPFNLTDVLEASVRADRLDALYRAYLPVLATFQPSIEDIPSRSRLGAMFLDVYVDRDPSCLACHTSTYSTTNARPLNANWDRFDPIWVGLPIAIDLEGAAFSYDTNGDFVYGGDGVGVHNRVKNLFRADNLVPGGLHPWGIDDTCVTNPRTGADGLATSLATDSASDNLAAFAGIKATSKGGVLDLVDALSDGVSTLHEIGFHVPDWEGHRQARGVPANPETPGCFGCHGVDPKATPLEHVVPTMSDDRLFSSLRSGAGEMPRIYDNDEEAWAAVEWVRNAYPTSPAVEPNNRNHAFVFLLAAKVVNSIVDEVSGEDLVMTHGFPRNPDQADALASLSMTFVERFSLQDVLKEIVLSDAFNRAAPDDPTTEPYNLPMLPFPEAEVAPTSSVDLDSNANSEGDFVHKHSPSGLLMQVHAALGWPAPPIAGGLDSYPTLEMMTALGRYTERTKFEREHWALDTYAAWESGVATCRKPDTVLAGTVHLAKGVVADDFDAIAPKNWVDWIDELAESAAPDATWEDLAVSIKDRLLADPTMDDHERNLIAELWDVDLGSHAGNELKSADVELLRDYCGVLLSSPQFVMRGTPLQPVPETLPDPVCLPGELCGEGKLLEVYTQQADDLGW